MIEFACNGNQTPFCTAYAVVILASFMRNTWMVKHAAHSTKAVIEKLTFTPGLRNAAMLPENAASEYNTKCSGMDALSSLHNISLTGYMDVMPFVVANIGKQSFKVKISLPAADITALATICADYVKDTAVSLTDITEHAARQTRTLTALMAVAKDFYRYPALAWPVLRKGGDDNIGSFELVHERHRHGNQSGDDVVNQIAELVRRAEMAETNTLRNRTDVAVMYQLAVELVKAKSAAEGGVPE